jgi:hypothetical protein
MSIALNQNEKPAPPIRRTPSMNTNGQHVYNDLQSRLKVRLKRPEDIVDQQKTTHDDDFPPPPDFLLSNDFKPSPPTVQSSLLEEIQRGGFKLRKTMMDRDRSGPPVK